MICGHWHEQKFKYPYPQDSKVIKMPYPRAKAINQIPALCPASPRPIDNDRCTKFNCSGTDDSNVVLDSCWLTRPESSLKRTFLALKVFLKINWSSYSLEQVMSTISHYIFPPHGLLSHLSKNSILLWIHLNILINLTLD